MYLCNLHVYEGNKESINQYKGVIITYSTAQRENAKSVSFQGLSQCGINKKSVCIRGRSAKQRGHDGQNTMSSRGHHEL